MGRQSDDYKRGYSMGYAAGRRHRPGAEMAALRSRIEELVERAERAEAGLIPGHCESCRHWGQQSPQHQWGQCAAWRDDGNLTVTPGLPWSRLDGTGDFITSRNFSCCLFRQMPFASGRSAR
jgi:hypothetical protein